MSWFADLPVQRKLRFAMMFTSGTALVLACGVFLTVEYLGARREMMTMIGVVARVTADNSTAAIAFDDPATAEKTLNALRAEPQVLAAALYDAEGELFASYLATPDLTVPAQLVASSGARFEQGTIVCTVPVVEESRPLGTLYVRAGLAGIHARMRTYGLLVAAVLGTAFLLVWLITSALRRTLAQPVLELARTAAAVSAGQDYALRAQRYSRDELGQLTDAFNAMLERTQTALGALRESEARFRAMADSAPVLIWISDTTKARVWFNQGWLDFVGRTLEQELDHGWVAGIHPEDFDQVLEVYRTAFDAHRPFEVEYRLRRRDGVYRWMLSHGVPRFGAAGEFVGYIGTSIDVSDRRRAEQEIAQARDQALAASRAKDDFLAALSHELRTPLSPVLLLASDAAQNPALAPAVRADFEMIAKNVALEARLIDDLLDLTRITRGKLILERTPVEVHALVRDALATVRADAEDKHQCIELQLEATSSIVIGDAVRLQQVLWNLLKNAVKFTPPEGAITVQTSNSEDGASLLVRVTDTGIGLLPAEFEHIFQPFSQGGHAAATEGHRFGGLGLGLAISRMLVEQHAGVIRARSAGRDRGASFEVELPLAGSARALRATPAPVPLERALAPLAAPGETPAGGSATPLPGRRRVLLVEDHAATRETLARLLTRRHFAVAPAGSVAEALAAAESADIDLLMSDIGLPDGDGYALLQTLRARWPHLPAIALSGYGMETDIARSQVAGFLAHLTKPVTIRALDEGIARALPEAGLASPPDASPAIV